MKLHPAQATIAKDLHRFRVLRCGRRFGKTSLIAEEIKGKALSQPCRIAYIANNYQQARDIAWEIFKKELGPAITDKNEQRLEIRTKTQKGGESVIFLRGWESVENLRGQAFDFLCLDEIASMRHFFLNWDEVLRPTLTDRKGEALFASTPKGFNHFYDLSNKELTDKEYKTFYFTSYDNPFIPKDEIDAARSSLPRDVFEQEYLASFQKTQGLVYKEFDREKHLYDTMPKMRTQKLAGVDPGYRNPAAVLDGYFTGEDLWIDDEWYKTERTDAQIADYVAVQKYFAAYPDPENAGFIEELRQRRVNVREVIKGSGSISRGIQLVREMLLQGRIHVNKRCVNLISEFEMYTYDDDDAEKNLDEKPIKAHDHALDALRYLVSSLMPLITRKELSPHQQRAPRNRQNVGV